MVLTGTKIKSKWFLSTTKIGGSNPTMNSLLHTWHLWSLIPGSPWENLQIQLFWKILSWDIPWNSSEVLLSGRSKRPEPEEVNKNSGKLATPEKLFETMSWAKSQKYFQKNSPTKQLFWKDMLNFQIKFSWLSQGTSSRELQTRCTRSM